MDDADDAEDDEDGVAEAEDEEVDGAALDVLRKRGKSRISVTKRCMKHVRAARTSKLES